MAGALSKIDGLFRKLVPSIYTPSDRDDVLAFKCAEPGDKPGRVAEKLIHQAPDRLADVAFDPWFVLVRDAGELVGVVIFGLERSDDPVVTVFTLGVKTSRHREGIGSLLKIVVMATAATRDELPSAVASQVHRRNYRMIGLNDNLGIGREPDPYDGEFLLTAAPVAPQDHDGEEPGGDDEPRGE